MLYPKKSEPHLTEALFFAPGAEYRGAPFWAWNCKLDEEQLLRQIEQLKAMGLGGFMIHARNGLATEYMGEEFMSLVKACVDKGKQENMLTWLYDEDRYPSGSAGGLVTKNPAHAVKYLLFTPYAYGEKPYEEVVPGGRSKNRVQRHENGTFLAAYSVSLDEKGYLTGYHRLAEGEKAETTWYAYLESSAPESWFNNHPYADLMSKEATAEFIKVTHQRYLQAVGDDFGGAVPAIFTDEPHTSPKRCFRTALTCDDISMPFTTDFPDTFLETYGYDILDKIPEIFWELPGGALSQARYHFHDHIGERFVSGFIAPLGKWCQEHNIMLTGHLLSERYMLGQTFAMSEAMRSYPHFQLPGIDILTDNREYTTAKQTQSVVRQDGRDGMISELYGVTNWDYDFRGHKLQGDWQAAMGVTTRVHHLTWVSMEGEAKRDYPASIGYQSPWYKEYPVVEDYFARLNTALTRGKAVCRIGVIHPIESYWLRFGPQEHTGAERQAMEDVFQSLPEWLLYAQLDFDYICESILPSQCEKGSAPLQVGQMAYDVVLVPSCITLRSSTVERLEAFAAAGGNLIFSGALPTHVDGLPSDRVKGKVIPHTITDILQALEPFREVNILSLRDGMRPKKILHQLRQDGDSRWLFICNGDKPANPDITTKDTLRITLKGQWDITEYDAITGRTFEVSAESGVFEKDFYPHDSLLLYMKPSLGAEKSEPLPKKTIQTAYIQTPLAVPITLSEPNVLLLDYAQHAINDEPWQPEEEILRVDAALRKRFNWDARDGRLCQPYAIPVTEKYEHNLRLRFIINSDIHVATPKLALERAQDCKIILNNQPVEPVVIGWYTDESITTIALPSISPGENILELIVPIGRRLGAEWCYLLGDFGVQVAGAKTRIIAPVRELSFGDYTTQGLPFYGGNVTYHMKVTAQEMIKVTASHFRNPLLAVDVDGKRAGIIAWAPYSLEIPVSPGEHTVDITAFGNRINTFGSVHNCDKAHFFFGPESWRTTGLAWSREYQLKPTGILVSPIIETGVNTWSD
ncbi:MAG: hypothetical protein FWE11_03215 [Defluviitaleaceae bacterium]|nr:hypothetical protein [Defluviitaleaceae bacterium]